MPASLSPYGAISAPNKSPGVVYSTLATLLTKSRCYKVSIIAYSVIAP